MFGLVRASVLTYQILASYMYVIHHLVSEDVLVKLVLCAYLLGSLVVK